MPTCYIQTFCFTFLLNLFLGLSAFSQLTFKKVKIHEDPNVSNVATCDPDITFLR